MSIIIPIYNAERYLTECIDSVLALKSGDWQLILVNDGSTDSSENICRLYSEKDSRILYLEQKNAGVSAARNNGIKNAEGEWITFLDADDMLSPDAFEIIDLAEQKDKMIVARHTNRKGQYSVSEKIQRISGSELQKSILNLCSFKKEHSNVTAINDYNRWSCWGRFYRTGAIRDFDTRFPVGIKLGEDLLFCLRFAQEIDNVLINESVIYFYRKNEQSVTQHFQQNRVENTVKLVEGAAKNVLQENKKSLNVFVIDRVAKCCLDYYTDLRSGLNDDTAAVKLKDLCNLPEFKSAVSECDYSNLALGKKNAFFNGYTLWFLKRKKYKILIFTLRILRKYR